MSARKHVLLVVDDERENLNLIANVLGDRHRVLKARDAASALEQLEAHEVHMILADQRMPGTTGVQLLEESRRLRPEAVRILVTAYPDTDVAVDAINRGQVRRFVSKPYDPEELRTIVRQELEVFDLQQANRRLARELGEVVEALLKANKELKELDRAKDHFLANVSHELRTPLVSATGYLDLILAGGVPPGMRKGLEIAQRNLGRLLALIQDLLLLARMRYRPDALTRKPFDLKALVGECVESLKARSRKASLDVRVSIPRGLPKVDADERRIHSVLTNVLSNAEKFTPDRARIRVEVRQDRGGKARVAVRDNGVGPSRAEIADRFPFFKHADDPKAKKFGGLGIGLALARQILAAHGCEITLGRARGGGAEVVFDLPLAGA